VHDTPAQPPLPVLPRTPRRRVALKHQVIATGGAQAEILEAVLHVVDPVDVNRGRRVERVHRRGGRGDGVVDEHVVAHADHVHAVQGVEIAQDVEVVQVVCVLGRALWRVVEGEERRADAWVSEVVVPRIREID